MASASPCFSCGSTELVEFYQARQIPVHSVLLMPSAEKARSYPRRDLTLGFCESCGFIQNTRFDPSVHEYSTNCEESQGFSPTFNAFARDLAQVWIDRYELRDKVVLEIGCGKGDFLALMCELGPNRGIGIDPGLIPERLGASVADRITCIQDFFDERYAHLDADFITCRHTLEHIQSTREFVDHVRAMAVRQPATVVAFELPDVARVLEEQAFWDIYYEHCSYFSLGSLARLFRSLGFQILQLDKAFGGQYLLIDAVMNGERDGTALAGEDDLEELKEAVRRFEEGVPHKIAGWRERLASAAERGEKTVVWGSSSKAVAFLTTLGVGEEVTAVTDINPYRQNMYIPGTGHEIVPPAKLKEIRPDNVVIMNPIYTEEIRSDLGNMGLDPRLFPVE